MRIISILNLKGGCGKTYTTVQMGHILNTRYGASVLLVDNDKQGNLSKHMEAYRENNQSGVAKLLLGDKDINSMGLGGLKQVTSGYAYPLMDIVDANMSLLTATYQLSGQAPEEQLNRYFPLRTAVAEDEKPYDFVIIDNPPDLGLNVLNALAVSDDVIVPVKMDAWAINGMDIIRDQIEEIKEINGNLNFMGVLVTMYKNNDTNVEGIKCLKEKKYKMFDTVIRYSEKADESTFFAPIMEYSPRSGVARSYKKFVQEYVEKVGFEKGEH